MNDVALQQIMIFFYIYSGFSGNGEIIIFRDMAVWTRKWGNYISIELNFT